MELSLTKAHLEENGTEARRELVLAVAKKWQILGSTPQFEETLAVSKPDRGGTTTDFPNLDQRVSIYDNVLQDRLAYLHTMKQKAEKIAALALAEGMSDCPEVINLPEKAMRAISNCENRIEEWKLERGTHLRNDELSKMGLDDALEAAKSLLAST